MTDTKEGRIQILNIGRDMAAEDVSDIRERLQPLIDDVDISAVIIRMRGVNRLDAAGIGLLFSVFGSLRQSRKTLILTDLHAQPRDMIRLSQLDRIITIANDPEGAKKILSCGNRAGVGIRSEI